MKKLAVLILLIFISEITIAQAPPLFQNTQTISSRTTLYKTLGGFTADSGIIISNTFPDTASANFSTVSRYNSIIRVGTQLWYRNLNPNRWTLLLSQISGGYLPISDTAAMLAGYKTYFPRTAISAGTGISYNNTTGVITNSAPDQTVTITAGTGITVSGTYPNFTVTNSSTSSGGTVTSVGTNNSTGLVGGTITTTGVLLIDTVKISTRAWRQKGIDSVSALLGAKLNISDTAAMLSNRLKISDTATMLSGYVREVRFLDSLTNVQSRIQTKQPLLTLTTTGSSGAATLVGSTLNIPVYTGTGGSGTVTSIATNAATGIFGGTITTSGTLTIDTLNISTRLWRQKGIDSLAAIISAGINGTTNYLSKFTSATTIGNSLVYDDGSKIIIGGTSGGSLFNVLGQAAVTNTTTYSSGTSTALGVQAITTYSGSLPTSNVSFSSSISSFFPTFNGNTTIEGGSTAFSSFLPVNTISFTNTGTANIINSTGGIKAISAINIQSNDAGTVNGTVNRTAGMQISGIFKVTGATATITRGDHYQLLISDINEYGNGTNVTNKWGIYQVGTNDVNLLNGQLRLPNLAVYADNTAALAGGLTAGTLYRTSTGSVMVVY
jgi:hypothetical protein